MRLAGVLAASAVMMSFSRRIGASPSMSRRVRWSSLVMTQSPIRMRSRGFSSTFRAIGALRESFRHVSARPVNGWLRRGCPQQAHGMINERRHGSKKMAGRANAPPLFFAPCGGRIRTAAARPGPPGWRATGPCSKAADGSATPACWRLPRWCRRERGCRRRSAAC